MSTRARDVSGVRSAGLNTMVQPAATAGAIFRAPIASGKFHGVTNTQGPTGSLVIRIRVLPSTEVAWSPPIRTASSENQRRNSAPYATSPFASARGLPISAVMMAASRSVLAMTRSKARRRMSARSRGVDLPHVACARPAASMAADGVFGSAVGDFGDDFMCRRVFHGESGGAGGLPPDTVDEQVRVESGGIKRRAHVTLS